MQHCNIRKTANGEHLPAEKVVLLHPWRGQQEVNETINFVIKRVSCFLKVRRRRLE